jgi:catechol 2,3-dioxygenase-like lactoylglutathione lyase family enzyme
MLKPMGIAHVNMNVGDLEKMKQFYSQVLGMQVAFEYEGSVAWLNFGQYRDDASGLGMGFHDVALFKVEKENLEDKRQRPGLNHVAWRMRSPQDVDAAEEYLRSQGVKPLKGDTHKEDNDRYLYFEDPEGNVIELVASTLPDWPEAYLKEGASV